jgi:hypothetical protein
MSYSRHMKNYPDTVMQYQQNKEKLNSDQPFFALKHNHNGIQYSQLCNFFQQLTKTILIQMENFKIWCTL